MENYREFLNRINTFEKAETFFDKANFSLNPSVSQKVSSDNSFNPFYGDTVVFDLDDNTKSSINKIIDKIYKAAPECFCERLCKSTLHMTLHDLTSSSSETEIAEKLFRNENKVTEIMNTISTEDHITMKSKYVFNMVGTSLVLGLCPTDENAHRKLMQLYELFDSVVELSYPLTPHITLAYYNVNGFSEDAATRLHKIVKELNSLSISIDLNTSMLRYQRFYNMNDYKNVLNPST